MDKNVLIFLIVQTIRFIIRKIINANVLSDWYGWLLKIYVEIQRARLIKCGMDKAVLILHALQIHSIMGQNVYVIKIGSNVNPGNILMVLSANILRTSALKVLYGRIANVCLMENYVQMELTKNTESVFIFPNFVQLLVAMISIQAHANAPMIYALQVHICPATIKGNVHRMRNVLTIKYSLNKLCSVYVLILINILLTAKNA